MSLHLVSAMVTSTFVTSALTASSAPSLLMMGGTSDCWITTLTNQT